MSDEKEKSAKELVGSIRRDAVELANKGISAAKKKLHDVDMNQVTSQTKELANKGISTAKEKLHDVDISQVTSKTKGLSGQIFNISMSSTKFLILYLLFMIPTYFVRFTAIGAALDGGDVENIGGAANFLLFLFLLGLCFVTYLRGKAIGKKHLVAFPIVALVFDLILAFIPLVPTVMHIITLVVGMPEPEGKNESEKI